MDPSESPTNQIALRLSVPQDQIKEFNAVMQHWLRMVPTLHFLDICAIGHIKTYLRTGSFKDQHHEASIQALQQLDLPHNGVSYFAALIEKASDQHSRFSVETFVDEARRDWEAIRAFFKDARVQESWDFVETYATDLFGAHPERSVPAYLAFLQAANDQGLHSPVPETNRLTVAQGLCEKALEFGISTSHPVVLVPIASVYGCDDARRVLGFSGKPGKFNPGNALGDIQSISRALAMLTDMVRRSGLNGAPFRNTTFHTADSPLQNMLRYFAVQSVVTTEIPDGAAYEVRLTANPLSLFPSLFNADRQPKDEKARAELKTLYELFSAEFPSDIKHPGGDSGSPSDGVRSAPEM